MCTVPKLDLPRSAVTAVIARSSIHRTNDVMCSIVYIVCSNGMDLCPLRIIAFPASYMKIFFGRSRLFKVSQVLFS
jgi:hypothetical protein